MRSAQHSPDCCSPCKCGISMQWNGIHVKFMPRKPPPGIEFGIQIFTEIEKDNNTTTPSPTKKRCTPEPLNITTKQIITTRIPPEIADSQKHSNWDFGLLYFCRPVCLTCDIHSSFSSPSSLVTAQRRRRCWCLLLFTSNPFHISAWKMNKEGEREREIRMTDNNNCGWFTGTTPKFTPRRSQVTKKSINPPIN